MNVPVFQARLLAVTAIVTALTTFGCSKHSSGVAATLKVGQLASSGASDAADAVLGATPASRADATYSSSDLVPSNGSFNFAHVDGIKISVQGVDLINGTSYTQAADWRSSPKSMEIGAGVSGAISITEDVTLTPGDYTGARIQYDNGYSVKAYCLTANKFVYTTAAGVVALSSAPVSLPSDYGYYSYKFAELTTADSPTSTSDTSQAGTDHAFTITSAGGQVAVLVDPSYLVTCYDGQAGSLSVTGAMSPFTWTNNNGHASTEFFPANNPNFGMSYIPMFVWISGDKAASPPSADTYFIGASSGAVQANPIDYENVEIATIAFNTDGSIFDMRGRITNGGGSVGLNQFFDTITKASDGSFSFFNGEWICDAGYSNCRIIHDREVTGFTPTDDFTTVSTASLVDGVDCGKTGTDPANPQWGNRYRACLGTPETIYWKKVQK